MASKTNELTAATDKGVTAGMDKAGVLAVLDRHLSDRADRAATTKGSQTTADAMLAEAMEARAAVSDLYAQRDALVEASKAFQLAICALVAAADSDDEAVYLAAAVVYDGAFKKFSAALARCTGAPR